MATIKKRKSTIGKNSKNTKSRTFLQSVPSGLYQALEQIAEEKHLDSLQQLNRVVLSEFVRKQGKTVAKAIAK